MAAARPKGGAAAQGVKATAGPRATRESGAWREPASDGAASTWADRGRGPALRDALRHDGSGGRRLSGPLHGAGDGAAAASGHLPAEANESKHHLHHSRPDGGAAGAPSAPYHYGAEHPSCDRASAAMQQVFTRLGLRWERSFLTLREWNVKQQRCGTKTKNVSARGR